MAKVGCGEREGDRRSDLAAGGAPGTHMWEPVAMRGETGRPSVVVFGLESRSAALRTAGSKGDLEMEFSFVIWMVNLGGRFVKSSSWARDDRVVCWTDRAGEVDLLGVRDLGVWNIWPPKDTTTTRATSYLSAGTPMEDNRRARPVVV